VKFGLVREVFRRAGHAAKRLTPKSVARPRPPMLHEVPPTNPVTPVIRMRMTRSAEVQSSKRKFKDEGNPIRILIFTFILNFSDPDGLKSGVPPPRSGGRDPPSPSARRVVSSGFHRASSRLRRVADQQVHFGRRTSAGSMTT